MEATHGGGLVDTNALREGIEELELDHHAKQSVLKLLKTHEPALSFGGLVESDGGPEHGHRFRITVSSCGASCIMSEEDPEPHDFQDSDWWGQLRTVEVRAHSLKAALEKAVELPFATWFEDVEQVS